MVGFRLSNTLGDHAAPVAPLRDVAAIVEARHQLAPHAANALHGGASASRFTREAVARQGGNYHMEGIRGAASVRDRVYQGVDDMAKLQHRTGPAVRYDQGQRIGMRRATVEEVDVDAVEAGAELGPAVQLRLTAPPVVLAGPVACQFPGVSQGDTLAPVIAGFFIRPPGCAETALQILQIRIGNIDSEWLDGGVGHGRTLS